MKLHGGLLSLVCVTVVSAQIQSPLQFVDNTLVKVPGNNTLNYCHDPEESNYILRLHSLDLNPNPPVPGNPLQISATGNLTKVVDVGSMVHVQVKFGQWITLVNEDFKLCENAGAVHEKCPFHKGFWNISKQVDMPKHIPSGTYSVKMQAYTNETKTEYISCMNGKVTF